MTIEVFGTASLNVSPDIATINVQVTSSGKTSADALTALSQKVNKILTILSSSGLNSSNWVTNYLYVYDNSSYVNGTTVVYGQIANQGMTITIPIPNSNGTIVGKIYDGLAQVKDITINGLTFDVRDKTISFIIARKLAYDDAKIRANDYLSAAGVFLGSPITITDSIQTAPLVINGPYSYYYPPSTAVSVGKINIRYNIDVVFTFKL